MVLQSRRKDKRPKAPADGVYTIGKSQFRIRKGNVIPDGAENFIPRERDAVVTAADVFSAKVAENTSDDEDVETTSEDDEAEATTKRESKAKDK